MEDFVCIPILSFIIFFGMMGVASVILLLQELGIFSWLSDKFRHKEYEEDSINKKVK